MAAQAEPMKDATINNQVKLLALGTKDRSQERKRFGKCYPSLPLPLRASSQSRERERAEATTAKFGLGREGDEGEERGREEREGRYKEAETSA